VSEPWASIADVAQHTGLSEKSIRRRAAELGAIRYAGRLRFMLSEVDRVLEQSSLRPRRKGGGRLRPVS
jgi:hypothetical protein